MAARPPKSSPTWNDVKVKLGAFDRTGLLGIVHELYAASKDNQAFLHARFGVGADVLKRYKVTIDGWLWPDVFRNQSASVSTAKKAIAEYKRATGQSEELAELVVLFCERGAGFSKEVGLQDEKYFDALVRMFEQALSVSATLAVGQRVAMLSRLAATNAQGLDGRPPVGQAQWETRGRCPPP